MNAAVTAAGRADGAAAAGWWQQDSIGGRTSGDRTGVARRVLEGLHTVDPLVLDALPQPAPDAAAEGYREHAAHGAPLWETLDSGLRQMAEDAYRVAFDRTMQHEVAGDCRRLLAPSPRTRATWRQR